MGVGIITNSIPLLSLYSYTRRTPKTLNPNPQNPVLIMKAPIVDPGPGHGPGATAPEQVLAEGEISEGLGSRV